MNFIKKKPSDYVLDTIVYGLIIILCILVIYPLLNALAISLNDANDTTRGGLTIYPRIFTMKNYVQIMQNKLITSAYAVTIGRTIVGTLLGLYFTGALAFGLIHSELKFRRFYTMLCVVTMYFSGGLIPTYFLIRNLHLINSFWVYIIPSLVNVFNMILMRSFFQSIPIALEESARIDGASYIKVFFRIMLPVSKPIIATMALFIGVMHWNDWFTPFIYVDKSNLKPMQSVLMQIVGQASFAQRIAAMGGGQFTSNLNRGNTVNVRSITMATMYVTIIPIVLVYPFLQRFFIKGIMIGSIKG